MSLQHGATLHKHGMQMQPTPTGYLSQHVNVRIKRE